LQVEARDLVLIVHVENVEHSLVILKAGETGSCSGVDVVSIAPDKWEMMDRADVDFTLINLHNPEARVLEL
jgi:hypothetical protein